MVLGALLVVCGVLFGIKNRGTGEADVNVFKVHVSGQSWLILVAMGVACMAAVWFYDGDHASKAAPSDVVVTAVPQAEFVAESADAPYSFGDDATLDALWTSCGDGDMQACDDLYQESPVGSQYESFGATCGRVFTADDSPESCVATSTTGDSSSDSYTSGDSYSDSYTDSYTVDTAPAVVLGG